MKSQVSMEFITIVTIMFLIFSLFTVVLFDRFVEMRKEKSWAELKAVGNSVKAELDLATSVEDGYRKDFWLPPLIDNKEYSITVYETDSKINRTTVALQLVNTSLDEIFYFKVPNQVKGDLFQGDNYVRREQGYVLLNCDTMTETMCIQAEINGLCNITKEVTCGWCCFMYGRCCV